MIPDWPTLVLMVKQRACELIRTGEYHQGMPVRELLVRCVSDVAHVSLANARQQINALPAILWAPVEAELTLLYARCARIVPPPDPEPEPDPESSSSTRSGPGLGAGLAALAAILGVLWALNRKR